MFHTAREPDRAGTPIMQAEPLAALDLPLKVLVWDDGKHTQLNYSEPRELARRYALSHELTEPLAAAITNAATAPATHS